MASYYCMKQRKDGSAIVESSNINAKEVFFGWGSDQNAEDGSFYGRQIGSWQGDKTRWRWTLSKAGVAKMIDNLERTIDDASYYGGKAPHQRAEKKAANELLQKLRAPYKR